jgi:hypothetical protein
MRVIPPSLVKSKTPKFSNQQTNNAFASDGQSAFIEYFMRVF